MSTDKKKPHWRVAAESIPFALAFNERNARKELRWLAARESKLTDEQRALRVELQRYLENPTLAAAVDQQTLLKSAAKDFDEATQRSTPYRAGRRKGTPNDRTPKLERQFDKLYETYRGSSAAFIRQRRATPAAVRNMSLSNFYRYWNGAKNRTK